MTTETKTNLMAWNGETYAGASDWYDKFTTDPEFLEYTEDLDPDELLRLAMFAHNGGYDLVPEDMGLFIANEQEAFYGEFASGAEFAEYCGSELLSLPSDLESWIVIDWEASYERNLRHDFFEYDLIDIDLNYRKFFWSANV